MGLAEPRKRRKISNDPNNTTWSRNTNNYGHRLLAAQGWTPGQYLGAVDAAHAVHYTAANASHVRVMLREENAGIGASRYDQEGKSRAYDRDNFGVGGLQDVLGRLNGRAEEDMDAERKKRRDVETRMYAGRKFGVGRFVSGGFLVGDSIVKKGEALPAGSTAIVVSTPGEESEEVPAQTKEMKRKVKEERKKQKKDKKSTGRQAADALMNSEQEQSQEESKTERRKRREEKRSRKEARRLQRKQRGIDMTDVAKDEADDGKNESTKTPAAGSISASPLDSPSTPSTPQPVLGGRQSVRSRYIAQKKLALADPKALREIFMVKA